MIALTSLFSDNFVNGVDREDQYIQTGIVKLNLTTDYKVVWLSIEQASSGIAMCITIFVRVPMLERGSSWTLSHLISLATTLLLSLGFHR